MFGDRATLQRHSAIFEKLSKRIWKETNLQMLPEATNLSCQNKSRSDNSSIPLPSRKVFYNQVLRRDRFLGTTKQKNRN